MKSNNNLRSARRAKNDEFYTRLEDVETELLHYKNHFKGKIVYCPCDDPTWSSFYLFFKREFEALGLSSLIATHYIPEGTSYKREYNGTDEIDTPLEGDGDFRSEECKAILDEVDIVATNPPFSLFREFVPLLTEKEKEFLVLGNNNAITYREIFPLIKGDKIWLGVNSNKTLEFKLHPSYNKWSRVDEEGNKYGKVPAISWFTNMAHNKRNAPLVLTKEYYEQEYSKYDNYKAIEISKTKDIPKDYYSVMGVPITFLDKYCPEQFEILGIDHFVADGLLPQLKEKSWQGKFDRGYLRGKRLYSRILIRRRRTDEYPEYPKYDNYDAIEVSRVKDIPKDYYGAMGVPITFLDKYCPEQFEIIGSFNAGFHAKEIGATKVQIIQGNKILEWDGPVVDKKPLYKRIIIRRRKPDEE